MEYFSILLGLSAAVSAIDIRLRSGGGCTGGYFACTSQNPNTCCYYGQARFPSVGFVAIPTSWHIQVRAWTGGACTTLSIAQTIVGTTNVCLNDGSGFARLSGGGYGFVNKKRGEIGARETCAVDAPACENSVKPNMLVLEDETTKFNIVDMPEDLLTALV